MLYKLLHNSRLYLLVAAVVAVAAAIAVGITTYRGAVALFERNLIARAETIVLSLDPREIAFLAGNASDRDNPFYVSLKTKLAHSIAVNEDIRFVYLAGKREGTIFLYMDSEPEDSPQHLPPGQAYSGIDTIFHEVFETNVPIFEAPHKDTLGEWVSAYVAISHPSTGARVAVLGIDVDAFEYRKNIAFSMATPMLLTALLFMIFLALYLRYQKEEELLYQKAEFLSIASHDLRAPLTGALWALQELQSAGGEESRERTLKNITRTLIFMKESVQGILNSSRALTENGGNASVDISEVITGIVDALRFAARERNVEVVIDTSLSTPVYVDASKEKVRHIFSNLISNAIKYSHSSGTVGITCVREQDDHVISVEDRGIGMSKQDQRGIFSPGFRARNITETRDGMGLGLYFTKRLVEECRGRIWFVSEENMGSKFYVALPASPAAREITNHKHQISNKSQ